MHLFTRSVQLNNKVINNSPQGMSRRQKLDQKKKDRKQEALQRKRVNSVGDSASAVVNNIATPPSVKTLTI